jgi:hypothetical protein
MLGAQEEYGDRIPLKNKTKKKFYLWNKILIIKI